ncbi:MAG: hypothetical protein NTY76_02910 [Candidatus Omnitrophica bacterium]|nr:hypothetical protein [Candidatus Omnitrophota bacterium]
MSLSAIKILEKDFELSGEEMRDMIKDFHLEMDKGLSERFSSLKMIPTYADKPTGKEKGKYIALDLGGTNFRIVSLTLKGRGISSGHHVMKFKLRNKDITSTGKKLFGFLARSVKKFIEENRISPLQHIDLGFTFSFPVRQTGIDSGTLVTWTKGFGASGVEGRDVVALLKKSFEEEGIGNISVRALTNDTVGTLVARSYSDRDCDVGVIIGTGTNACYVEALHKIKKLGGGCRNSGTMIINIEWGNFNKLKATRYDEQLDKESDNPRAQMLEKMVSGMYLGEVCRLIIKGLISKKILFEGAAPAGFNKKMLLKGEFVSQVLADRTSDLADTKVLLRRLGVKDPSFEDLKVVRRACELISTRAARISAAAIVAVVTKIDPHVIRKHTIAIDGSVYEKLPGFSEKIKEVIGELSGRSSGKIKITLTKDGSGYGAAIIAAISTGKIGASDEE